VKQTCQRPETLQVSNSKAVDDKREEEPGEWGGFGPDHHTDPCSPVHLAGALTLPLSGLLLGTRHGVLARAVYVLVGAIGVPVFAEFSGGLGIVLGPTGGRLISYPIAAAVAELAGPILAGPLRRRAFLASFLWGCAGLAVIYAIGASWLAVATGLLSGVVLVPGLLIFVSLT
jgi:biotin transport system substrate-specific component